MTASRSMVVDDLAELRWAMEPAVHPSDAVVAYVDSGPDPATDRLGYDLYVAEPDGEPRMFQQGARRPRWSPLGDRIAFSRHDDGRWVPASMTVTGEEAALIAPSGDVVDIRWGPDGRGLLVVVTTESSPHASDLPYRAASSGDWSPTVRHSAWIVEPDIDPVAVADALVNVSIADWSPDGKRVAVVSDEGVDLDTSIASGIWLWSTTTGETECVVPPTQPIYAIAWSPDGSSIAYLAGARDNASSAVNELWVLDMATQDHHRLGSDLDRSLGKAVRGDDERGTGAPILAWALDSGSVMTLYADGGRSRLARFGLTGGHEGLDVGQDCVLEFGYGSAGLAFSWSDPLTPGEISWMDMATGETRQMTRVGDDLISRLELAPTTRISVVASDGVNVEGWLTLPAEAEGAPLVLQVHGGPHYAVGERFSFDAQRLAARGIAVLRANPRGSQGYGQAFANGNLGDWGGRDLEDLLDLVEVAVETEDLDPGRVAVIGESYGGYIAAWAAGSSDRFVAAVVENGIADLLSSAGGAIGPTFWHSELGSAPWDDPSIYVERSPITRLDHITIPVLVIHCEADTTCSITQGEALYAGLRELGREVEFWRVPGEGHFFNVFGAFSRRLARTSVLDDFLVRHLRVDVPDARPVREEIKS